MVVVIDVVIVVAVAVVKWYGQNNDLEM